jgi:hypothetical protein
MLQQTKNNDSPFLSRIRPDLETNTNAAAHQKQRHQLLTEEEKIIAMQI